MDHLGEGPFAATASRLLHRAEHVIHVALGVLLTITALTALGGAASLLIDGLRDWRGTETVLVIMDRLLLVLMLVEILYTVRASIESGTLRSEPFLLVGLIACVRRILVLSLETSGLTQPDKWSPENASLFRAAMTELGVLAGLIVVTVGAIVAIRRTPRR